MRPATRDRIEEAWAKTFGLPVDTLRGGGTHVAPSADESTVLEVLRLPRATVVTGPPEHHDRLAAAIARVGPAITEPAAGQRELADLGAAAVGVNVHSYNDDVSTLGPPDDRVLVAPPGIRAALQRLARTMRKSEWHEAGFDDPGLIFTLMERRAILAAAHLSPWDGHLAELGFVTRPSVRGRGYGTIVVAAAARDAIARHGVARWRTRSTNVASLAVARRLGFEIYGEQLAFKLRSGGVRTRAAG